MTFTSFEFLLFFATVVLVRSCLPGLRAEKWLLLGAGVCFYLSWSVPCILLVLFTSVVDFQVGRKLGQTEDPTRRQRLLWISLAANLGLLGFFKYTNFLLENVGFGLNALGLPVRPLHCDIVLPPALSYFTFASLSYVLDVYYERLAPCPSQRDYGLFVSFFPKLLAGPIMRAGAFFSQFQQRGRLSAADFETGLAYFLIGAVKKVVISDQVAGHVDLIFSTPSQYDCFTLWQGLFGYALQIYCDFSGYSDMAIGTARLLRVQLPENFQMPYSAASIAEFWRRWHITLSAWFRDYVFLPLEMATRSNPNATLRAAINLLVTMLLCGLWHGASWNFVIWGGLHGGALAVHKAWTAWNPLRPVKHLRAVRIGWGACAHFLTLAVVVLAWVFFRAPTWAGACDYLRGLGTWSHGGIRLVSHYILPALAAVALTHLLVHKDRNLAQELPQRCAMVRIAAYAGLLLLLAALGASDSAPFIYFKF